ncbi:MAG: 23S rRNA (adenine(2030)-N(6))-methyltransferase RlmJ [Moraxellaceae bacterium]|nr:23S rRNA (adenine(2030)-N(6))-methyltransferase RlmJ [Moraxellaceae bacterium]
MNYRHLYHAGNFADVMKHALLMGLLNALKKKDKPFCYVDSHAGAGVYDLHAAAARKTGEAELGFGRLNDHRGAPPMVADFLQAVLSRQAAASRTDYPGSPWLAVNALREQDQAILLELQHAEATSLRYHFARDRRVAVHERDAYEGLPALLPPPIKRGLVLIDPPYENEREHFPEVVSLLHKCWSKWPTGMYAVWYPIKQRANIVRFHRNLMQSGITRMLACELLMQPDDNALGLNGSGLIIVNPPFGFDRDASQAMAWLLPQLSDHPQRKQQIRWLANLE